MADIIIGSVPTYMGTYQSGKAYCKDNVVSFDGNAYISLIDGNDRPLSDASAWDVFSQGLNGIFAEAACGKQKLIRKLAGQGADIAADATYDQMADAVEGLFLPHESDFWKAFGYDTEEDDAALQYLAHTMNYMIEQWQRVLDGDLKVSQWTDTFVGGKKNITMIPKIDTSSLTSTANLFDGCSLLTAIPCIDTSHTVDFSYMFYQCEKLTFLPKLDTSNVVNLNWAFYSCKSLKEIPELNTSEVQYFDTAFYDCTSLMSISSLDSSQACSFYGTFKDCVSLKTVTGLNFSKVYNVDICFKNCISLVTCNIRSLKVSLSLSSSPNLSEESVAYIVSNAANTSAITITLHAQAYERAIADPDVQQALSEHPLVTLASA